MPPPVSKQSIIRGSCLPWKSIDAEKPRKVDNPSLKFQRQAEIDICLNCNYLRCVGNCHRFAIEKDNLTRQMQGLPKMERQPRPRREIDRAEFERMVKAGASKRRLIAHFHIGRATLLKLISEWGLDKA